ENNEMNFAEAVEETLKPIKSGEVVKGVVIGITPTEVRVDIGNKYDGVIPFSELTDDSNADINELVKLGEEVEVYVVLVSDRDGVVTLSKKKIDAVKGMEEIRKAFESGEILTGRVLELVKGGVVSIVKGVRVFIPVSECAERFLADLGVLLGTEQRFRIIKLDEDRRGRQRVVGSIKSVAKEESEKAAAEFWANAEVGKKYTGKVKSLTSFGAFVDLGGVDGLVHISELSWNRIKHPSEVVKAGDEITVYIKDMNKETGKVSLGYKKEEDSPWVQATKDLKVGDVIKCKIVRILPFGAFAEVAPYVDGLIHVSQISNERIDKPSDVLAIGDEVETKIVEINDDTKQIGLSIKALMTTDDSADEAPEEVEATSYTEDSSFTLGDILDAAEATEDADNTDAE
ncbi:MAG TPA: 30S ribosomal protein S1, partial [Ruminococcus sp.]|nr:30S ribosomal protein S1 [Ruminococcus sp.]